MVVSRETTIAIDDKRIQFARRANGFKFTQSNATNCPRTERSSYVYQNNVLTESYHFLFFLFLFFCFSLNTASYIPIALRSWGGVQCAHCSYLATCSQWSVRCAPFGTKQAPFYINARERTAKAVSPKKRHDPGSNTSLLLEQPTSNLPQFLHSTTQSLLSCPICPIPPSVSMAAVQHRAL